MFYSIPDFPDLNSLILAGLPKDVQDRVEKIALDYDSGNVVEGLGAGGASTAKGATVYFKDEKVNMMIIAKIMSNKQWIRKKQSCFLFPELPEAKAVHEMHSQRQPARHLQPVTPHL